MPLDGFAAHIHALPVPRSQALLLGDGDFVANETLTTAPLVKHRYVLGGTPSSPGMSDLADSAGTFAPLGAFALMGGPRHTTAARGPLLRSGQRVLLATFSAGQAPPEMTDEHGSAVGGIICETPLPPWLCSLSLAGAAPISEVNLRVAWHFGGAPGSA